MLCACPASRKPGSGRHHSPRNQAIEFVRPRFKLLPVPFSLHLAQNNTTFSITSSLPLCLSTYCNCIPLFYTSASAPSTTSQSQNEDFNCSPRCRCELRLFREHQRPASMRSKFTFTFIRPLCITLSSINSYLHLQLLVTTRNLKLTAIPYSKHA